jgi:hypothetical protein
MYAIVKDGIVEMKTNDGSNILDSKIVYASKGNITSISARKTGETIYVGFVEDGQIYYLSINENKIS